MSFASKVDLGDKEVRASSCDFVDGLEYFQAFLHRKTPRSQRLRSEELNLGRLVEHLANPERLDLNAV